MNKVLIISQKCDLSWRKENPDSLKVLHKGLFSLWAIKTFKSVGSGRRVDDTGQQACSQPPVM
jgi:hypothetical protein